MRFPHVRALGGAILAVSLVGAAACSDSRLPSETAQSARPAASSLPSPAPANEQIVRLVAAALRDPAVRGMLRGAMANSPVHEGKLHLATYVRGRGNALLKAVARANDISEAEFLALLEQTRPLEIYLPIDEHRAMWTGDDNVIVATQMSDHDTPFGVDLNGNPVKLSTTTAPTIPTIAIVPAESFDAAGQPIDRAQPRPGDSHQVSGPRFNTTGETWTGLWVNYIEIPGDYEGVFKGDPEYEMYLERASDHMRIRCAEQSQSVEPFRWDMNGRSYTSDFLIAWEQETPTLEGLMIYVYEDDDTRCQIRDQKDYATLAANAVNNYDAAYKAFTEKKFGEAVMQFIRGTTFLRSFVASDDELVGVVASAADLDTQERVVLLKDENRNDTGKLYVQWKTDVAH